MASSRAVMKRSAGGTDAGSVSTIRLWKRMNALCVWATARFSSLRKSGITALRFLAFVLPSPRGRSKPFIAGSPAATVLPVFRCSLSAL